MHLKTLSDGRVTGTGNYTLSSNNRANGLFGGVLISTDGTNAAVVTVSDVSGKKIFDISTVIPGFAVAPIHSATPYISFEIIGAGAAAQFYEWID